MADPKPQLTKAQIIAAYWEKGHLKYKLESHQIPLYEKLWSLINGDIKSRTYVINCARRFGKSFVLTLVAIEFAIRNPNSFIRFALPVAVTYSESHLPAIDIITDDAPADFKIEHLKSEKRIVFGRHGSNIKFAGTDDDNAKQLRGASSHLTILDEAGFMMDLENLYKSVLYPQVWRTNGKLIFSSTPPQSLDHDFVAIYREHKESGLVSEFTINDNTSLSDEQRAEIIETLGGVEATIYKREALCQFVQDEEISIFPEWKTEYEQSWDRSNYFPYYTKYSALDYGTVDRTVVLFGYYDFENAKLIIEGEVATDGKFSTDVLAVDINAKKAELQYTKLDAMVADNSNLLLIQDLSVLHKLYFQPVKKIDLESMVNRVKILIKQGKIIVNPACTQLIGCLRYGQWKSKERKGHEFGKSKAFGHYDGAAALVYLVRILDTVTNPIPHMLNINPANSFVPRNVIPQTSDTGKKIGAALLPNQQKRRNRWRR